MPTRRKRARLHGGFILNEEIIRSNTVTQTVTVFARSVKRCAVVRFLPLPGILF